MPQPWPRPWQWDGQWDHHEFWMRHRSSVTLKCSTVDSACPASYISSTSVLYRSDSDMTMAPWSDVSITSLSSSCPPHVHPCPAAAAVPHPEEESMARGHSVHSADSCYCTAGRSLNYMNIASHLLHSKWEFFSADAACMVYWRCSPAIWMNNKTIPIIHTYNWWFQFIGTLIWTFSTRKWLYLTVG